MDLAEKVGIDKEKARAVLTSDLCTDEVRKDEQMASRLHITGVPYFVFEQKYAVSGAQPPDVFLDLMNKIKEEELGESVLEKSGDES